MSSAPYTLHYWPVIPGRGEFVRLAFEYAGQAYNDTSNDVQALTKSSSRSDQHPLHFAVPILQIDRSTSSEYISQTGAILSYLAIKLHLDGTSPSMDEEQKLIRRAHVQQLTLTALDVVDEAHDTHHPVAVAAYYEEQKDEAARRASDFRANRLPKFFDHFAQTLKGNPEQGGWLIGSTLTVADLTLFNVIEGLSFAFPKRMAAFRRQTKYKDLFTLRDSVAETRNIADYLKSDRRKPFGNGIFRHYPELDGEDL